MAKKYKYQVTIDNMPEEVKQLRTDLNQFPEIDNSWYLLRFLRARNFDLDKTEIMLINFFKYRKTKNFDNIKSIKMPDTFLKDLYIRGYCNVSKNGQPIGIERVGFTKTKIILEMYTLEFLDDYFFQQWERFINIILPICSQQAGKRIDKVISILDLKNLNINKVFDKKFKQFLKDITNVSQHYYPEILEKMYIINAPLLFKGIWQVIKITLDKQTRNKINIFWGSGKKELKQQINEEDLVEFLGGKFKEPLYKQCGPWSKAIQYAEQNDQIFLPTNEIWSQYFLTEEEKQNFKIKTFNKTKKNNMNKDNEKDQQNTQSSTLKTKSQYLNSINSVIENNPQKHKINQTTILVKFPKFNSINQILNYQFRKSSSLQFISVTSYYDQDDTFEFLILLYQLLLGFVFIAFKVLFLFIFFYFGTASFLNLFFFIGAFFQTGFKDTLFFDYDFIFFFLLFDFFNYSYDNFFLLNEFFFSFIISLIASIYSLLNKKFSSSELIVMFKKLLVKFFNSLTNFFFFLASVQQLSFLFSFINRNVNSYLLFNQAV